VKSAAGGTESERFIVLAAGDGELRAGVEMEAVEEFEKFSIFLVNANDFGAFVGLQVGEKYSALLAELRETAAQWNAVRARFFVGESFEEKSFNFWRDGVFEALGFIMRFGPREAYDVGEQHFGELMAKGHAFRDTAAFAGEIDVAVARNRDEIVAAHAFDGGGDGRRCDVEFLGKARANGWQALFEELPDGFEVVFL
jgi:hypothetical protein